MVHRPGHFTNGAVQLREAHGRIHFAGSDIAGVEAGAIEGAMDTGAHAARKIAVNLQTEHVRPR